MAKLTKETRDALPADDFAVPGKRALPIHDATHVKMAFDMVSKTKDLTPSERSSARKRIIDRAKKLGVDTKNWGKVAASMTMVSAMALNISNSGHPNKMPFSGVMTRIGEPSDEPPGGSGGRLITISAEAAEKNLESLLGMAVDYVPNLDGHDPRAKIGIITAATIDGNAICIEGFIYATDFPDVAAEIKASKDILGFSYECREIYTNDPEANPCVITDCIFTGAAILLKSKAAYHSTSIQASIEKDYSIMSPEQEKTLNDLVASVASVTSTMTGLAASVAKIEPISAANLLPKVEPHASKMEACADSMEAAGIGGDPHNGHAVVLRKMAGQMRAEAAQGRMPSTYSGGYMYGAAAVATLPVVDTAAEVAKAVAALVTPLTDKLAAMGTQLTDLKAAAFKASESPERKTAAPAIAALLARTGLTAPADGAKFDLASIDKALKDLPIADRLNTKSALSKAGLID